MRRTLIGVALLAGLLLPCRLEAQTTTLTQTAAGPNCSISGCINTPLSDKELITWCHTNVCQKLSFRGLNYFMTAKQSGWPTIAVDLDSTAYENNGFMVHTDFDSDCFRCVTGWDDGTLTMENEYVGSGTFLYGWNGSVNVTSGTGQVGLVTATPFDQTVTLMSSDATLLQVPSSVVILAGTLDSNFTITATAPTATASWQLAPINVTVTATFPDGTASTMTVTVGPLPPPPPSSMLEHKPGTCWWDGKGADWMNIQCAKSAKIILSGEVSRAVL